MNKILSFLAIFYLLSSMLHADSVEAKLSTTEVVEGNPVMLQIKAVGDEVVFPDITDIAGVPVTGSSTQRSSNFTYINGNLQGEKSTTRVLRFLPKKNMKIPSFTVMINGKPYRTEPIELKLVKSKAPQMKQSVFYEFVLKTDKKEVMVGESFVMTLFVSVSDRVQGAKLDQFHDPLMEGFYVKELGDLKHYRQNGYTVVEKQYLLTAKEEGNLTIKGATAKLGEADLSRRDFFGRYGMQWHPIASNDLAIRVKPKPGDSDLLGVFTIDATVDAKEVKANKPVNLTVTILGEGSLEDFEFPKYEIDGVSVFSDEAKIENKVVDGKLQSSFTKTFAFISDRDFTIPSRSFTVYNPEKKALEYLEVASYEIKVKSDATALKATVPVQDATPSSGGTLQKTDVVSKVESKEEQSVSWWMLVAAFTAGMSVMYLLMTLLPKTRRKNRVYRNDEALQILYPHINESAEIEEMVRKLYARKNGDTSVEIDKKELKALIGKCSQ